MSFLKKSEEYGSRNNYYNSQKVKTLKQIREEDRGKPFIETHDEKERNYLRYYPLAKKTASVKFGLPAAYIEIIVCMHDFVYVNPVYISDIMGISCGTALTYLDKLKIDGYTHKFNAHNAKDARKFGFDIYKYGVTTKGKRVARFVYNFCERYEVK